MPSCTRASLMCGEDSGGRNSFRRNFFDLSGFSPRASGPAPVPVLASGPAPVRPQLALCPSPGLNFRPCPSPGPISGSAPVPAPACAPAPVQGQLPALPPVRAPASGSAFCPGDQVCRKRFPTAATRVARGPFLPGQLRLPGVVSPACFTWAAAPAWCSLSGLFHLGIQDLPRFIFLPKLPAFHQMGLFSSGFAA